MIDALKKILVGPGRFELPTNGLRVRTVNRAPAPLSGQDTGTDAQLLSTSWRAFRAGVSHALRGSIGVGLTIGLAACGGGKEADPQPTAMVCAKGPGTYSAGSLGDPMRLCELSMHAQGDPIVFGAAMIGLEGGTYFWRYQVGAGPLVTGSTPGGEIISAAAGDFVKLELLVAAPKNREARWAGASLNAE